LPNAGAEAEAPADAAIADARPVLVIMPPVCNWEARGAVRQGRLPRHLREDRLRRIEDGRDALRQERDVQRARVEDLEEETNR
jgi:hypothetical protein